MERAKGAGLSVSRGGRASSGDRARNPGHSGAARSRRGSRLRYFSLSPNPRGASLAARIHGGRAGHPLDDRAAAERRLSARLSAKRHNSRWGRQLWRRYRRLVSEARRLNRLHADIRFRRSPLPSAFSGPHKRPGPPEGLPRQSAGFSFGGRRDRSPEGTQFCDS